MKRRAGRGTLILIALLFASSGAIRLGDGFGLSLARAADNALAPKAEEGGCAPTPAALAAALSAREARVLAQETALADRSAALDLANAALDGRLEALEQAEARLRQTLAIADGAAEADLARLTAVYETMKPRDAATLFDAMDARFAAGFLGRMRPDAAAAVLSGMSPDKAYEISAILAGRNALAPQE
ncbi:MotE family protein [Pseudogemmobacter humi]|uniref:Magnesium transporter MgtE intracellular domain-containing protein n=1 Tax=Pseudogemmobacter humi TaxID=2483812 RepID=A0A3P5WLM4_9RHOB|nr:hypothetical protein [Pseudogemmobacter humi]VDC20310.1 hypothetical protein XINFAN_00425 [Pseudogemmobacter humi]